MLEPVRDDLELQLADRAEQQQRAGDRPEHLDRAFLAELRAGPAFSCLVRSGSATSTLRNISGAKNGSPVNCSVSPSVKRVAELQHAVVRDADDVAGEGLVEQLAALRQER